MNKEQIMAGLKDTAILTVGVVAGSVAAKFAVKTLNPDGKNEMLGQAAPFAVAAASMVGTQMVGKDLPAEAKTFLKGVTIGATYQGVVNLGVQAKIETGIKLAGVDGYFAGALGEGVEISYSDEPEILFEDTPVLGFDDEPEPQPAYQFADTDDEGYESYAPVSGYQESGLFM